MKKSIKSIVVLVCICAVVSVLLALTNSITAPIIKEKENQSANAALIELLPDGGSFEEVNIGEFTLPSTVTAAYRASNGGCVVKISTTGYASGLVIMCGINADGTVSGSKIIASAETPSIGGVAADKIAPQLVGKTAEDVETVDVVAGATKTTAAYRAAIKDALNTALILGGETIDVRTEEEILADNLNAALPDGQGAFTKHFFMEIVDSVDAIYTADNGAGYVCLIDELFIGVSSAGQVVTECEEDVATLAVAAVTAINETDTAPIDVEPYKEQGLLTSRLISASKTSGGNYVIEIEGAGFGVTNTNEYLHSSGEYIVIRISMTADGRIIDCLTVYQAESKGYGDACANESFYGQFDGKTEENYTEVDAISGATLTTNGYMKAIERAFAVVKFFEEGNQ